MRVLVPLVEDEGFSSRICNELLSCSNFGVYDTVNSEFEIIPNIYSTPIQVLKFAPDLIIVREYKKNLNVFKEHNVKVGTVTYNTVCEVIENVNKMRV